MLIGVSDLKMAAFPSPLGRRAPASLKLLEKGPDHFGAVDVVVLRAQHVVHHARKARVREAAGHAMTAIIDAVQYDVDAGGTFRGNLRHRRLIVRITV